MQRLYETAITKQPVVDPTSVVPNNVVECSSLVIESLDSIEA